MNKFYHLRFQVKKILPKCQDVLKQLPSLQRILTGRFLCILRLYDRINQTEKLALDGEKSMVIRNYSDADEKAWLYCRVVSFLDCSYFNDVKTSKDIYEHPSISLVAEEDNRIIGFIDVEIDSDDLTGSSSERGAVIWHLGVLPEYRSKKIATQLWLQAKEKLLQLDIHYCEVWTQQDIPANQFYIGNGFVLDDKQTWLRCYLAGSACMKLMKEESLNGIYGPEEIIIDIPCCERDKWADKCYRVDEVRLYSTTF